MNAASPPNDTGTMPNLSAAERPLGPGDTVDRYRIDHMIAAGGMARVYRATHAFTGRTVALKVMRTRYMRRPDLIERFKKEAMALSQIRHSNVVTIENGGLTEKGEVFIAMEFLQGHTLRDVLVERGQLPIREALSILIQIALGVGAAHEVNVVHRDLKPENIFCTSDGAVKVLDLGLAKFIGYDIKETDPAKTGMIGTAAYIAPERLDGLPIDARCDVYALGLIAYECLAGFHPLVPDGVWPSSEEIALRQLTFDPPVLRQLPSDVWAAIARAMHKDRERRFASMDQFASVLHRIRDGLSSNVSDPRPSGGPIASQGSVRSLEGQVVPRVASTPPRAPARPTPFEAVLRYPVIAGAVMGLVGAFGLFLWKRGHHVPSSGAAASAERPAAVAPPAQPGAAAPDAVSPNRTDPNSNVAMNVFPSTSAARPPAPAVAPTPSANEPGAATGATAVTAPTAPVKQTAPAMPTAPTPSTATPPTAPAQAVAQPRSSTSTTASTTPSARPAPNPSASSKPARRLALPSSGL